MQELTASVPNLCDSLTLAQQELTASLGEASQLTGQTGAALLNLSDELDVCPGVLATFCVLTCDRDIKKKSIQSSKISFFGYNV